MPYKQAERLLRDLIKLVDLEGSGAVETASACGIACCIGRIVSLCRLHRHIAELRSDRVRPSSAV